MAKRVAKKIKADSLFDLTFVSDPQLHPRGKGSAAVRTYIDTASDKAAKEDKPPEYKSQIYLFDHAGGEPRAFTQPPSTHPRWSPDGSQLAFLSSREGFDKPQLFVMPVSGGEAQRRSELKDGVKDFAWSPEGVRIAFISRGDYEDKDAKKGRGRVIERMFYKGDGVGFKPERAAQIYLLELGSGACKRLTKLEADPSGVVWAPDGQSLYFTAAADTQEADDWHSRLWRLPLDGQPEEVIKGGPSRVFSPQPSPDGESIAFFCSVDPENFGTPTGLWTVAAGGGEATLHTAELEVAQTIGGDSRYGHYPNRAVWSEDGRYLFFIAEQQGRSGLMRLEPATGAITALQKSLRAVTAFSYARGQFAFVDESPERPGELQLRSGRGQEKRLSLFNADFLERYRLAAVSKERGARSKDGTRVPYWVLTPDKPRKDKALVLQIHGGPHTAYGYGFSLEFQLLAAAGYTVVYGNPRGSSSYGRDFATAVQGRYGSIDAEDVMAIARHARRRHGEPTAPIHLTGGSYGGFMTNWLLGHTTTFRSAVTQRSISNWLSFYGSSDIGYRFSEREVGGNPWQDTDKLWEQSPIRYAANITTPLLILHAEEDHRCPVEQAEQLFIALKRLGRAPVKFIRYPDEGHEHNRSGRPDRRVERLRAILDWFKEHA